MDNKYYYNRKLPHWQPAEETFFITYRLADSLPISIIEELKDAYSLAKSKPENQAPERKEIIREEYWQAFEEELEKNLNEPHWLKNDAIAEMVYDSLLFQNNKQYILWAACLMSNHVHTLISTLPGSPLLHVILQNHKKFTARQGNKLLGRSGKFWAEESFDTRVRDDQHFHRVTRYILFNPVKAGLVDKWSSYKWIYLHPELANDYNL